MVLRANARTVTAGTVNCSGWLPEAKVFGQKKGFKHHTVEILDVRRCVKDI